MVSWADFSVAAVVLLVNLNPKALGHLKCKNGMKTTNVLLGLIAILLAVIIILILRNNPINFDGLNELTAKLTEPPQREFESEDFTFDDYSGTENSNKTCLIIYTFGPDSGSSGTIIQSNLIHSSSEIIRTLSQYGWQLNKGGGGIFQMIRPIGQSNVFFFVGDPDDTNKVLNLGNVY